MSLKVDHEAKVTQLIRESKVDDNGCWNCALTPESNGYCRVQLGRGKKMMAHRYIFQYENGPIPDELIVMHECDNPRCINPGHLRVETAKENNADMWKKGRAVVHSRGGNPSRSH